MTEQRIITAKKANFMAHRAVKTIRQVAKIYEMNIPASKNKQLHDLSLDEIKICFKIQKPLDKVKKSKSDLSPPSAVFEMPVMAKETEGVFEIILDSTNKFRFHLKAANGQIIAVSQAYGAKESAIEGIDSIKKNALIAKIADLSTAAGAMAKTKHAAGIAQDPVFEIQFNAPDRFRFHLKAANGQIIAVSQAYLSKQSAETGIASVKKNAPMAKVLDHTIATT